MTSYKDARGAIPSSPDDELPEDAIARSRGYNEAWEKEVNRLRAENEMSEWIRVDDRLPEEDGYYLVYGNSNRGLIFMTSDWYDASVYDWWHYPHAQVTHWMPLPEPPESEE